jgi:hypothetical protein
MSNRGDTVTKTPSYLGQAVQRHHLEYPKHLAVLVIEATYWIAVVDTS